MKNNSRKVKKHSTELGPLIDKDKSEMIRNPQDAAELLQTVAKELYIKNLEIDKDKTRLDKLLSSVIEIIFAIDEKGRVTLFNNKAEQVFGIPISEIYGKKYSHKIYMHI